MALLGRSYTIPIVRIGDPNAAPVDTSGPLASVYVSTPTPRPVPSATVITRIGDPNAAPVAAQVTAAPTIIQPIQPRPFRGQAVLGAAAADIYFTGPYIATPVPPKPVKSTTLLVTPLGTALGEAPPPPFIITRQAPRPTTNVMAWQQRQDGSTPDVSGPTPTQLVVTRPRPSQPDPLVVTTVNPPSPPAQIVFTVAPMFVRASPRHGVRHRTITARVFTPVGPAHAPYIKVPTQNILEAHSASVGLDAHSSGVGLDPHTNLVALDPHGTNLTLDAHGSQLALEP